MDGVSPVNYGESDWVNVNELKPEKDSSLSDIGV